MKSALVLAMVLVTATPAFALEGRLVSLVGAENVIVWRSKTAMDEGDALMRAKADYRLLMPLGVCIPAAGTRAVTTAQTEGSMFSGYAMAVTVIEGPSAGCRGFVKLKEFVNAPASVNTPTSTRGDRDKKGDVYRGTIYTSARLTCLNSLTEKQWPDRDRLCPSIK